MWKVTCLAVVCLWTVVVGQAPKARLLSDEEQEVVLEVLKGANVHKDITLKWSGSLSQHSLRYNSCKWRRYPEMYTVGHDKAASQATWVGVVASGGKPDGGFLSEILTIVHDWKKAAQRKPSYYNFAFFKKQVMKVGCSYTNRCKRIIKNRYTSFTVLACKFTS